MFSWIKPLWLSLRYLAPPNTHTHTLSLGFFLQAVEVIHHIFHSLSPWSPSQSPHLFLSHLPKHFSHACCAEGFQTFPSTKTPPLTLLYWHDVEFQGSASPQIPWMILQTSVLLKGGEFCGRLQQTIVLISDFFCRYLINWLSYNNYTARMCKT